MSGFVMQSDGIPQIVKSGVGILDYNFDWGSQGWLTAGETISNQVVTTSAGITISAVNLLPATNSTLVQIWLSGGSIGQFYLVTCQITTTTGRTDERSFRVYIQIR